jgi:RND superfamily putative drug exporter
VKQKDELGLADVRSLAQPIGSSPAAKQALESYESGEKDVIELARDQARSYYVSRTDDFEGKLTRIDLTLTTDPLSRVAIASFPAIKDAVERALPSELKGAELAFVGSTASLWDLGAIKRDDQRRVEILVSAVVLVLLLIVFRRFVLSVYLVLSVLFSYFATLGLTYLVFRWIAGESFVGLDWKVPIFLFTILVAVGEDYNIFLIARIKEEHARHGPLEAVPVALARTGSVISSCGFIMAGTFASLLSGTLRAMHELGFALAFGVLLDTLVVRPILVPTFLVLLQQLIPGPIGRFMAMGSLRDDGRGGPFHGGMLTSPRTAGADSAQ